MCISLQFSPKEPARRLYYLFHLEEMRLETAKQLSPPGTLVLYGYCQSLNRTGLNNRSFEMQAHAWSSPEYPNALRKSEVVAMLLIERTPSRLPT